MEGVGESPRLGAGGRAGRFGAAAGAAVLALAVVSALLARDHARGDSATMDEPFHALAAAEYVLSGTYWANLEHPPLAKLLAGVSMAADGVRAPLIPRPFSFAGAESPVHFVFANDVSPDDVLAAARRPFPWLLALVVVVAAAAAWREAGLVAGLLAAAFLAFEPNHVAHAGFLHTDVAASLGLLATVLLAVRAAEGGRLLRWAAAGLAWGLSMAAKFSLIYAGPFLLLVVLLSVRRTARAARGAGAAAARSLLRPFAGLALAAAVAVPVLLVSYLPALRSMSRDEAARSARLFMEGRFVEPAAAGRIEAISRVLPPAGHFLAGLAGVASQNRIGGGVNFLRGEVSVEGFPAYFPIAFGVKSPLGLLGLLGAGGVAALAAAARRRRGGPAAPGLLAGACVLVSAGLFLAASGASYNIGVRHVLPAVPLLVVAAVVTVVRALGPLRSAAVLLPLALLEAGETLRVHPHELAFFNALAGGPSNGAAWLSDSNLDWGQDLRRLAARVAAGGRPGADGPLAIREEELTVAYFGGDSPGARLPRARLFDPVRAGRDAGPASAGVVPPGLYAVSEFLLQCGPEFLAVKGNAAAAEGYARLRRALRARGEPVGRVGYSIGLYRIREEGRPAR